MEDWLGRIRPAPRIVGRGPADSRWVEPLRTIYDHELVLFSEGEFTVEVDGRDYPCPPNSFLIVPPGRLQASATVGEKDGVRRWTHFDWIHSDSPSASKLVHQGVAITTFHPAAPQKHLIQPAPGFVPNGVLRGRLHSPERVLDLHDCMEGRWNHGSPHDREVCGALLLEILLELLGSKKRATTGKDDTSRLASKARYLLAELAHEPRRTAPSVQASLKELGCSYGHVARLFRQTYGVTPLTYVNAQRIQRARRFLRDTGLSVSEIAHRTGFDEISGFSRLFRKQTGMSPREFRRQGLR